jgi:hypothetical protein
MGKYLSIISVLGFVVVNLLAGCAGRGPDLRLNSGATPAAEAMRVTPEDVDAGEPDIAVDAGGSIYLVYAEHLDGRSADVKLLRLGAYQKSIGQPVKVSDGSGDATIWTGDPPRMAVSGQNVYIAWTRKLRDVSRGGNDLMLSISRDQGSTFEPPVRVNDDSVPASHGMHSLGVGQNGHVIMLWLDERSLAKNPGSASSNEHGMTEPNAEVYYAVSKDSGQSFGANKRLAGDVCPCCKTALLIDSEGTVYAAWRQVIGGDYRHIALARSDDGGENFANPVIVSDDRWQLNACPVSGPALISPQPGTVDIIWYTAGRAGQSGMYFARSADRGNSFAPRILLSNEAQAGTPAATFNEVREVVLFAAADAKVGWVHWEGSSADRMENSYIQDAILPSAAAGARGTILAFVRTANSKRSVWMQELMK